MEQVESVLSLSFKISSCISSLGSVDLSILSTNSTYCLCASPFNSQAPGVMPLTPVVRQISTPLYGYFLGLEKDNLQKVPPKASWRW